MTNGEWRMANFILAIRHSPFLMVMVMPVSVMALAFRTGLGAGQFAGEVAVQRVLHGSRCAGNGFNVELFKKLHGSAAHSAAEHYIGALLVDKAGYLPRPVSGKEGVCHAGDVFYLIVFYINQNKVGASAKMMTGLAV